MKPAGAGAWMGPKPDRSGDDLEAPVAGQLWCHLQSLHLNALCVMHVQILTIHSIEGMQTAGYVPCTLVHSILTQHPGLLPHLT